MTTETAPDRAAAATARFPRPLLLRRAAITALVVGLLAVPQFASPFTNLQLTLVLVYGVAILGLDVLVGRTGQVSLGQSAFLGLGAYGAAYAFDRGWGPVAALALAVVLSGVVAVLAAIPAVRLKGFAFGIITLALPVFGVPLANRLADLTGGSQGLGVVATTVPAWTGQADDQWRLYLVAVVAAVVFWVVRNLLDGRLGRALAATRVNEAMATATGVAVHRHKVFAFAIAGLCGGVAGWLYLVAVQFVSPAVLQLNLSVSLLVALVVGGVRSPLGCLLGAAFFVLVPDLTDDISPGRSYLINGICLLLVLFFFPGGLAGALRRLLGRLRRGT
ncbi:MAG TPA: branched-chain amino acid ABC transporter permease [Mycobacteriales bacterium]|nr:branched-chain amino acid ABC transporter permease [Mycobacteriales bacterium]